MGIFTGGVPTDIEVRRLHDQWPSSQMKEGQIIPYYQVENVVGEKKDSCRYKTITNRWRKQVEAETDLVIKGHAGKGFLILNSSEKLDMSTRKLDSARRSSVKAIRVAAKIKVSDLNDEEKTRLQFVSFRAAGIIAASRIKKPPELPTM